MSITVRDARPDDLEAVIRLMRQLAEHEGLPEYFLLTEEALARFCDEGRLHVLVAATEDAVVGYATYMVQFSPWAAGDYLFVDDVYVSEESRGEGVGLQLMERIAAIALERDVEARWHVEPVNRGAQKFYAGLGVALRDKLIAYWTREAMRARTSR